MNKKIAVVHYDFNRSYLNKNVGYFVDAAISKGYDVDFLTPRDKVKDKIEKGGFKNIEINANDIESLELYRYLFRNRKTYDAIWLYPSYRKFYLLVFFCRMLGINPIIKTDSMNCDYTSMPLYSHIKRIINWKIVKLFSKVIIVENKQIFNFFNSNKCMCYGLGLPSKNINIIKKISKKYHKEKVILYAGRIAYEKGLERLVNIFESALINSEVSDCYKLKVIGKIDDEEYYSQILNTVENSDILKERVIFENEKSGEDYYSEIISSQLVVLPTRDEGLPNILGDCYYCNTLFLTTKGAKADHIINNKIFFSDNDNLSLKKSMIEILNNSDKYYNDFGKIYNNDYIIDSDGFFSEVINKATRQ